MFISPITFNKIFYKGLINFLLIAFIFSGLPPVPTEAQEIKLPLPGVRIHLSPPLDPPVLKGMTVDPKNPFHFDFILDKGDSGIGNDQLKDESKKLIKYFLASITTPEKDLWVNLSPYEKNRIIPKSFGQTDMGRDLLAQDYLLKQITSSLIYPEEEFGKKFWKRVYAESAKRYGKTDIPVNTFNKVWIVPEHAKVYEHGNTAYVVKARLKVMLEEDYLSMEKHDVGAGRWPALNLDKGQPNGLPLQGQVRNSPTDLPSANQSVGASQVVREIVLPQLEMEVNEGLNFAPLRQVYYSLILAVWFKKRMKDSILGQKYMDQNKVRGIHYDPIVSLRNQVSLRGTNEVRDEAILTRTSNPKKIASPARLTDVPGRAPPVGVRNDTNGNASDVDLIYQRYLKAFKKGVYNYIKEEPDPTTGEMIPRKYFSGGFNGVFKVEDYAMTTEISENEKTRILASLGNFFRATVTVLTLSRRRDPSNSEFVTKLDTIKTTLNEKIIYHLLVRNPFKIIHAKGKYNLGATPKNVTQGAKKQDSWDVPLMTATLITCTGLMVVDPDKKSHFLFHIDQKTTEDEVINSLKKMDLSAESQIAIIEGSYRSNTFYIAYRALKKMRLEKKIKILTVAKEKNYRWRRVLIYKGNFYGFPDLDADKRFYKGKRIPVIIADRYISTPKRQQPILPMPSQVQSAPSRAMNAVKSVFANFFSGIKGALPLQSGVKFEQGVDFRDYDFNGIKLRVRWFYPDDDTLEKIAQAVAETHQEISVNDQVNSFRVSEKLAEKIYQILGAEETTLLGSKDLLANPLGIERKEGWVSPVQGASEHWMTYTKIGKHYVSIDATTRNPLTALNAETENPAKFDAELIVGRGILEFITDIRHHYGGDWQTWEQIDPLSKVENDKLDPIVMDLENLNKMNIKISYKTPEGNMDFIDGFLLDFGVSSDGLIILKMNTGGHFAQRHQFRLPTASNSTEDKVLSGITPDGIPSQAMIGNKQRMSKAPGGIDLTLKRMNLEVEKDQAMVAQGNVGTQNFVSLENIEINGSASLTINGLYIKDIEIKSLDNLPQLLGVGAQN